MKRISLNIIIIFFCFTAYSQDIKAFYGMRLDEIRIERIDSITSTYTMSATHGPWVRFVIQLKNNVELQSENQLIVCYNDEKKRFPLEICKDDSLIYLYADVYFEPLLLYNENVNYNVMLNISKNIKFMSLILVPYENDKDIGSSLILPCEK